MENPEVQCHIHKGSPVIPILSRINPIPCIDTHFLRSILILSSHLCLSLPKGLFPVGLPVKILYIYLFINQVVAHLSTRGCGNCVS